MSTRIPAALAASLLAATAHAALAAGTTQRVSVSSAGGQSRGSCSDPALSRTGQLVAFDCDPAADIVVGSGGGGDVYLRDRQAATTTLVSVGTGGAPSDDESLAPKISADGRVVAFESFATNLVAGDTNSARDVFVRDLKAGTTVRASVGLRGRQGGRDSVLSAISGNGRFVAFDTFANNLSGSAHFELMVRDLQLGRTTLESVGTDGRPGDGDTERLASISGDGRFLAFASEAGNLVATDRNPARDVFLRDRQTGRTVLVSVAADGGPANDGSDAPFVSDDGSIVAFSSFASNLVPGDTNGATDAFVRDMKAGRTTRISLGVGGKQANSRTFVTGLSADGRRVLLSSDATNLVAGDTDGVRDDFVFDRVAGTITRVSLGRTGAQPNHDIDGGEAISADGGTVAFATGATNLVPADTNGATDVFVRTPAGP
jgi:Tol biopolymer transport system component